jgi:hypothetical protein
MPKRTPYWCFAVSRTLAALECELRAASGSLGRASELPAGSRWRFQEKATRNMKKALKLSSDVREVLGRADSRRLHGKVSALLDAAQLLERRPLLRKADFRPLVRVSADLAERTAKLLEKSRTQCRS